MHYRRERLMIPMIVVSTLMVVAIGLLVYGFMIDRPELIKQNEKEVEAREKVEKSQKQMAKDILALEKVLGLSKDVTLEFTKNFLADKNKNGTGSFKNFPDYVNASKDKGKKEIESLKDEKKKLEKDVATRKNQYDEQVQTNENMKTRYENDIIGIKEDFEAQIKKLEFEISKAKKEIIAKKKLYMPLEDGYAKLKKELQILESELNEKTAQLESANKRTKYLDGIIEDLKRGKAKEYTRKAVGEVITAQSDADTTLGTVNIGSKDGLKQGIIFEVMHGDDVKGRIRVIEVNERFATFQVIEMNKGADPIIAGDKISSPMFTPGEKPEFVILGKFKTHDFAYSREDIVYMITQWGGKVVDKITANTRYVIVGDQVEEKQLRTMGAYGIERINKGRLKDFLETK